MIKELKESDDYDKFWTNFGKYIKVGVVEDEQNIEELSGLCLWTMR
jgi:HSP90 family molecular chaperone